MTAMTGTAKRDPRVAAARRRFFDLLIDEALWDGAPVPLPERRALVAHGHRDMAQRLRTWAGQLAEQAATALKAGDEAAAERLLSRAERVIQEMQQEEALAGAALTPTARRSPTGAVQPQDLAPKVTVEVARLTSELRRRRDAVVERHPAGKRLMPSGIPPRPRKTGR